jgi:hypothetical protein
VALPDPALLPLSEGLPLPLAAPLETALPDPDADEPDVPVGPFELPVLGAGPPPLEHATSTVPTTILATTSHDFDLIWSTPSLGNASLPNEPAGVRHSCAPR